MNLNKQNRYTDRQSSFFYYGKYQINQNINMIKLALRMIKKTFTLHSFKMDFFKF